MLSPLPTRSQWPNLGMELPRSSLYSRKRLTWCIMGENATGGATKCVLVLTECTLVNFNNTVALHGNKSIANYTGCIQAVILGVFPQKALQNRKRWMRCFLKKLQGMPVWDYIARVTKMKNIISQNPPSHCRWECHQTTRQQATRPTRLQNTHQLEAENSASKLQTNFWNITRLSIILQTSRGNKNHCCNNNNNEGTQKHYCMLHGHNPTHSTNQCHALKKEVKKVNKLTKMVIKKIKISIIIQAKRRFTRLQNFIKSI